jgi:hypothetical protein
MGLAPATTETLRLPVVGRCLYPFFHKLSLGASKDTGFFRLKPENMLNDL